MAKITICNYRHASLMFVKIMSDIILDFRLEKVNYNI